MEKNKKNMLIVAGILLLVNALSHLTIIIVSLNNVEFITVYVFNLLEQLGLASLEFVYFESLIQNIIYMAYFALPTCLFSMFVIFNLINKTPEKLEKLKALIVITALLTLLFGNIISFILVLFALLVNTKTNIEPAKEQSFESVVTKEIESIRKLYNQGAITKQEYDELVKKLFNKIELR